MKKEEESHQAALIQWAAWRYPYDIYPYLFHIPNGGYRNKIEASNLKKCGVKKGVCDLFFCKPNSKFHGLFIEMKSSKGRLSDCQKEFIETVEMVGYDVLICRDWEEGKNYILEYMNG